MSGHGANPIFFTKKILKKKKYKKNTYLSGAIIKHIYLVSKTEFSFSKITCRQLILLKTLGG